MIGACFLRRLLERAVEIESTLADFELCCPAEHATRLPSPLLLFRRLKRSRALHTIILCVRIIGLQYMTACCALVRCLDVVFLQIRLAGRITSRRVCT